MKKAAIFSIVLHILIFLFIIFKVAQFRSPVTESPPLIIDFETVGPKSKAKFLSSTQEKKEDMKKQKDPVKPTDATPDPEQKTIEKKENTNKKEPEDDKLKIDHTKEKTKDDTVALKPNDKKKPEKKKEKEKPKKKPKDDMALLNLGPKKKTDKTKPIDSKVKSAEKALDDLMDKLSDQDGNKEESAPADSVGDTLTVTEIQAVIATLKKCWVVPIGTQGALDTSVDITLHMNEDGTVRIAEIEDMKRFAKDPVFRVAAESAQRAALDPKCNPLPLPRNNYSSWKKLQFEFNPRMMMGVSGGLR